MRPLFEAKNNGWFSIPEQSKSPGKMNEKRLLWPAALSLLTKGRFLAILSGVFFVSKRLFFLLVVFCHAANP